MTNLAPEVWQRAVQIRMQHDNDADAARAAGMPRNTFRHHLYVARIEAPGCLDNAPTRLHSGSARRQSMLGEDGAPPIPDDAVPPPGFVVKEHNTRYDGDGVLKGQTIKTGLDAGEVYQMPAGLVLKGESALVDQDGRVFLKWVKSREGAERTQNLIDALLEVFAEYKGAAPVIEPPAFVDDELLTLYPLPDLHLGMYAWGREVGEDYDVPIAVAIATSGISDLVAQARPTKRAVILGLGDYFHANDSKNVTPTSKHLLDVDGRWAKVYLAGARLAVAIVGIVAQKHEEVEVVLLPGNHDEDAAITLRVALSLLYAGSPRITVNDSPGLFWYRRFGASLIGATHGHTMKLEQMPLVLANDRREDWGLARFRYFFSGHVHHDAAKTIGGVHVESITSPAVRDAWTTGAGHRSVRSLTSVTFHIERGRIWRHWVDSGRG
jgi:hypothetical protein